MKSQTPIPDTNDVSTVLRLLAESLDEEEKRIRDEGSKAMNEFDYEKTAAVLAFAKRLQSCQKKVLEMQNVWNEAETRFDKASPSARQVLGHRFFGGKKPQ